MDFDDVIRLGSPLPEVEVSTSYGTPALKVRGKGFVRLKEDRQSIVFLLESVAQQGLLIASQPGIYFITDHYRGYPAVLARLAPLRTAECRLRLERAWRVKAPKKLIKLHDEKRSG